MTPDETRRRLERDARYDAGLAALLECLRDGHRGGAHAPMFAPVAEAPVVRMFVRMGFCDRCGLTYWVPDAEAMERERVYRAAEAALEAAAQEAGREERERQRVIDENVRQGGGSYRPTGGS